MGTIADTPQEPCDGGNAAAFSCGPKDRDRRLRTAGPIARTPLEVHHRKDADGVRSDRVEKRVGKAPKESKVDGGVCASGDPAYRSVFKDCIAAPLRFSKEGAAETRTRVSRSSYWAASFELLFGEPVERNDHFSRALASRTPRRRVADAGLRVPSLVTALRLVRRELGVLVLGQVLEALEQLLRETCALLRRELERFRLRVPRCS